MTMVSDCGNSSLERLEEYIRFTVANLDFYMSGVNVIEQFQTIFFI